MKFPFVQLIPLAAAMLALSGCGLPAARTMPLPQHAPSVGTPIPNITPNAAYRLAPYHWTHVAKIRAEAHRLGMQVNEKQITKVQAAQYLNRYRLALSGSNPVDDNIYEVYQRAAVESQRGAIDSAQSKAMVESALHGWHQRWRNMPERPANPAFANFLMEVMNLEPLQ